MSDDDTDIGALIAKIINARFPMLALAGFHTYYVKSVSADHRCDLVPTEDSLPAIRGVDLWPGVAGGFADPVVGSQATIAFRDNREDRPMLVSFQPLRVDGGTPDKVGIDGDAIEIGEHATAIELGGPAAESLAKSDPIVTWADAVVSALSGLGVTLAPLADPATEIVKGR
jgi:hypothetical protein